MVVRAHRPQHLGDDEASQAALCLRQFETRVFWYVTGMWPSWYATAGTANLRREHVHRHIFHTDVIGVDDCMDGVSGAREHDAVSVCALASDVPKV